MEEKVWRNIYLGNGNHQTTVANGLRCYVNRTTYDGPYSFRWSVHPRVGGSAVKEGYCCHKQQAKVNAIFAATQ